MGLLHCLNPLLFDNLNGERAIGEAWYLSSPNAAPAIKQFIPDVGVSAGVMKLAREHPVDFRNFLTGSVMVDRRPSAFC
jgi:hypothetical protein